MRHVTFFYTKSLNPGVYFTLASTSNADWPCVKCTEPQVGRAPVVDNTGPRADPTENLRN